MEPLRVIYDGHCPLCRRLAEYGRARGGEEMQFEAWEDFVGTEEARGLLEQERLEGRPERLCVLRNGVISFGVEAWREVLEVYPPFEKLRWIAVRLGLIRPVARVVDLGGRLLHGRCKECR